MVSCPFQVLMQFFDHRFMAHRVMRIFPAHIRFGWINPPSSMNVVQFFGPGIIGFKIAVLQRPFRGYPSPSMAEGSKILFPEAKQSSTIHFGISPHPVAHAWLKGNIFFIHKFFRVVITSLSKDLGRVPVYFFPGQKISPLKNKYFFVLVPEGVQERPSARPCSYDDDIVMSRMHYSRF